MTLPYTPPPAPDRAFWIGIRNAAAASLAFYAALYFGIHPFFALIAWAGTVVQHWGGR